MKNFKIIIILFILLFPQVKGQNIISFDNQSWTNNQTLPSNFTVSGYSFSSNEPFYTNYGYNFDVNGISLYYVFQNPKTDIITITTPNGALVNLISLAAYQVSEVSTDSLIIEGWDALGLKYSRSFPNDSSWEILTLNYNKINKIIIKIDSTGDGGLTDYNFDNFTFGNVISYTQKDSSASVPQDYSLSQNYPNPFNPSTVINYRLAKDGKVVLKVYDLLGREISTLVDGEKAAGSYSVTFNANNLSSGMYIYIIKADGFVSSNKMILLK